ncbi:MAG TPA: FliA/WhiG family RNA polymerase sigma factor, partial [Thermodesulfobacteriota bacterium]|nr:FliA/WhiG family RNA polymerase sigma factor [Thermodesulfobacteriota bacterium]
GVAKLSTFVESRIRGAMLDELRSVDWIPKSMRERIKSVKRIYLELEGKLGRSPEPEEVAERLDMSLDEYYEILRSASVQVSLRFEDLDKCGEGEDLDITECVADPSDRTPLNILEESTMRENLARLIDGLPEKERLVLSLYYWEEMTMKEIGKILGITEGRVSQLHNQALLRLKVKLEP